MSKPSDKARGMERRSLLAAFGGSVGGAALAACSAPPRAGERFGAVAEALATGTNIKAVDVVDALSSLQGGPVSDVAGAPPSLAIVQAYSAVDDGGGGVFAWVDPALVDQPLVGDQGTIFPVVDGTGWWVRAFSGAIDVRWFGAKPGSSAFAESNSAAFARIQTAIQNGIEAWGRGIYVPPGEFHLASDLIIVRAIDLFGDGIRSESRLLLAQGKSVIVDSVYDEPLRDTGAECQIRDLQIVSAEGFTIPQGAPFDANSFDPPGYDGTSRGTPGIRLHAPAYIARVFVAHFSGTGICVLADGVTANANQWRIHDVFIASCGGHGIHVDGGETQGGFCSGAKVIVAGGTGIYESSAGGNTYVGCYVEEISGRGYTSDTGGQATFIGCFAEAREPSRLASAGTLWFGGSSGHLTPDSLAFIAANVGEVYPFNILNAMGPSTITTHLGLRDTYQAALGWQTSDDPSFFWERWSREQQAWLFERQPSANPAEYVTGSTENLPGGSPHPRGVGVRGFPWFLLGSNPAGPYSPRPAIRVTTGLGVPDYDPDGDTWRVGDRVLNAAPEPGGVDGWVCVTAGSAGVADWRAFGSIALNPP